MNQDKAKLSWFGKSLLERQYSLLESILGSGRVVVSGPREPFPHVLDETQGLGPIEGVRTCMRHLKKNNFDVSKILVIPVDMPLIDASLLHLLCSKESQKDVVKFKGYELPAVIFLSDVVESRFDLMLFELLEKKQTRNFSFKSFYQSLCVEEISLSETKDIQKMRNTNTREEWDEAISTADHTL